MYRQIEIIVLTMITVVITASGAQAYIDSYTYLGNFTLVSGQNKRTMTSNSSSYVSDCGSSSGNESIDDTATYTNDTYIRNECGDMYGEWTCWDHAYPFTYQDTNHTVADSVFTSTNTYVCGQSTSSHTDTTTPTTSGDDYLWLNLTKVLRNYSHSYNNSDGSSGSDSGNVSDVTKTFR
jgi:hypothetical protein